MCGSPACKKSTPASSRNLSPRKALFLSALLVLFLSACLALATPPIATRDEASIYTAGAQTNSVHLTLEAGETSVALLTRLARQSSNTPTPPATVPGLTSTAATLPASPLVSPPVTITSLATTTPAPSPTISQRCDQAQFLLDITIPPGSSLPVGAAFLKVWRIQNIGSCTWTSNYILVFAGGDPLGSTTFLPFPNTVVPGQTVDLSVSLSAPNIPGTYQGSWLLRNPSGATFGMGPGGIEPLQVRINTVRFSVPGQFEYDLVANYCTAFWQSAVGARPCPGNSSDSGGSVILIDRPAMENGRPNEPGLWVRPNQDRSGWLSAQYPVYTVARSDHFLAEAGCLANSPGCNLVFQLDYRSLDGFSGRLGSWREDYDGQVSLIDVDLSALAGRSVLLILSVMNNGAAGEANGVWLGPRVANRSVAFNMALDWIQEVPGEPICNALQVFLTGPSSAQAVAYSCAFGQLELGRTPLTGEEFNQLAGYLSQLQTFKGNVFRAGTFFPTSSRFTLYGYGRLNASDADIQAINSLATRLLGRITGNAIIQ